MEEITCDMQNLRLLRAIPKAASKGIAIGQEHEHFQLLKNFQEILPFLAKDPSKLLPFIRSGCLYESPILEEPIFRCCLQIALSERLLLFGKNPTAVLAYCLNSEKLFQVSEEVRRRLQIQYGIMLMDIYDRIQRPEN